MVVICSLPTDVESVEKEKITEKESFVAESKDKIGSGCNGCDNHSGGDHGHDKHEHKGDYGGNHGGKHGGHN